MRLSPEQRRSWSISRITWFSPPWSPVNQMPQRGCIAATRLRKASVRGFALYATKPERKKRGTVIVRFEKNTQQSLQHPPTRVKVPDEVVSEKDIIGTRWVKELLEASFHALWDERAAVALRSLNAVRRTGPT